MANSGTMPIRILLIDDHVLVRAGLRILIESHPGFTVVAEAGNRSDALALATRKQPDIILLDLMMGDDNGLNFLPELLSASRGSRVIVLTGLHDAEQYCRAVQLGAAGLVLKDQATDILLQAIEQVHHGEVWLDQMTLTRVMAKPSHASPVEPADPEAAKVALLTAREREVISLLGQGLANREIAERLFISQATVRHHVESIYNKLALTSRLQLILFAYRHGLASPPT
jgi:DNA-binding NarL/FixJ family response regulator